MVKSSPFSDEYDYQDYVANGRAQKKPKSKKITNCGRSCSHCRRVHVACDVNRPCAKCMRNGWGSACPEALERKRKSRKSAFDFQTDEHFPELNQEGAFASLMKDLERLAPVPVQAAQPASSMDMFFSKLFPLSAPPQPVTSLPPLSKPEAASPSPTPEALTVTTTTRSAKSPRVPKSAKKATPAKKTRLRGVIVPTSPTPPPDPSGFMDIPTSDPFLESSVPRDVQCSPLCILRNPNAELDECDDSLIASLPNDPEMFPDGLPHSAHHNLTPSHRKRYNRGSCEDEESDAVCAQFLQPEVAQEIQPQEFLNMDKEMADSQMHDPFSRTARAHSRHISVAPACAEDRVCGTESSPTNAFSLLFEENESDEGEGSSFAAIPVRSVDTAISPLVAQPNQQPFGETQQQPHIPPPVSQQPFQPQGQAQPFPAQRPPHLPVKPMFPHPAAFAQHHHPLQGGVPGGLTPDQVVLAQLAAMNMSMDPASIFMMAQMWSFMQASAMQQGMVPS